MFLSLCFGKVNGRLDVGKWLSTSTILYPVPAPIKFPPKHTYGLLKPSQTLKIPIIPMTKKYISLTTTKHQIWERWNCSRAIQIGYRQFPKPKTTKEIPQVVKRIGRIEKNYYCHSPLFHPSPIA